MSQASSTSTPLGLFLAALFDRAWSGSLLELRWPVPDGMHRSFHLLDALEIASHVQLLAQHKDVYFGVLPRRRRGGQRRDLAGSPRTVWADCDGSASAGALSEFELAPSLVVRSGSGENRHAFWLLSHAETLAGVERANRRLAAKLGADAGLTRATAILRLPHTFNHKHSPPVPVGLEVYEPDRRYPLSQLLRVLPADPSPPVPRRRVARPAVASSDPLLAIPPEDYFYRLTGRRPGRSRKVNCPLHDDRRASLHVYADPARGWYCFGCRRGGSVFDLAAALWRRGTRGVEFTFLRLELERLLLGEPVPPASARHDRDGHRRSVSCDGCQGPPVGGVRGFLNPIFAPPQGRQGASGERGASGELSVGGGEGVVGRRGVGLVNRTPPHKEEPLMANHTYQTGRLTADPELRATGSGMEVSTMRLAVQRRRGKEGEDRGAFFINVVAFNGLAGVCNRYLSKGSRVLVSGQLDVQEWTGQDSVRRYTPQIIAEQVEFLDPSSSSSSKSAEQPATEQAPTEQPSGEQSKPASRRSRAKAAA